MSLYDFDVIILGFGKAGKTLAVDLASADQRVAVVEKSQKMYGGTCINIACIPTKTLVSSAEQGLSFDEAFERKNFVVETLHGKNEKMLRDKEGVWLLDGTGSFVDKNTIRVINGDAQQDISAEKIIINTGSLPNMPDYLKDSTSSRIVTSTEMLDISDLPKKLGIIGGGYIGIEFASTYASFGSEVTVFHDKSMILERDEPEIRTSMTEMLENQGIKIIYDTQVTEVNDDGTKVSVVVGSAGYDFDMLLVAVGRHPNIAELNCDAAGVGIGERGEVVVDDNLKTSAENIWAVGDVNGGPQFTYVSLDDYRILKSQLLGDGAYTRDKRKALAYSVFTETPYAWIGISEATARDQGHDVRVKVLSAAAIPRLHVDQKTSGVLKAVVDAKTGMVLGASLLCRSSYELINTIKTVMDNDLPYTVLRDQVFTHPTVSESLNDLFTI